MTDIQKKIQEAVKDMYSKVVFNDESHVYETTNGEWLQGVSTVSSIVPKDWLSAWGAKEAVKALGYSDYPEDVTLAAETMAKISSMKTPQEFIAFLKEAKGASKRKSKQALVDGEAGHSLLEQYVKFKMGKEKEPIATDNLVRPYTQFKEWADREVDYWILSEARVAYPEKGYAGTLDAMAMMKNGRLAVIDFKFASHISEDYHLQTAGYAAPFEPYGIQVDDRIIVRLPKTLKKEEWNDQKKKYEIVENNIEIFTVDTPYELDRDTFFACLPVKRWINYIQNKPKKITNAK